MAQQPKLLLVEGDPILGMEAIQSFKRDLIASGMPSSGWVEMPFPERKNKVGEFLNAVDGEVSLADWGGDFKCVLLRGLSDRKSVV